MNAYQKWNVQNKRLDTLEQRILIDTIPDYELSDPKLEYVPRIGPICVYDSIIGVDTIPCTLMVNDDN